MDWTRVWGDLRSRDLRREAFSDCVIAIDSAVIAMFVGICLDIGNCGFPGKSAAVVVMFLGNMSRYRRL